MKKFHSFAYLVALGLQSLFFLFNFNFVESAFSQSCPSLSIQYKAATNSFTRYGYNELTNLSVPPKMYLSEKIIDSRDYNDIVDYSGDDYYGAFIVQTGHDINSYNLTVAYNMSAMTGSVVSNVSGTAHADTAFYQYGYDPDFDPSLTVTNTFYADATDTGGTWTDGGTLAKAMLEGGMIGYGGPSPGAPDAISTDFITQTAENFSFVTTSPNYLYFGEVLLDRSSSHVITLANENTDGVLFGNLNSTMPAYSGWGDGCGAASSTYADASCGYVTGVKMTYRIYLQNWKPRKSYKVKWNETTTTWNFTTTNVVVAVAEKHQDVTPTGDQTQPYLVCTTEILDPTISYPTSAISIGESPIDAVEIPSTTPGDGGPQ